MRRRGSADPAHAIRFLDNVLMDPYPPTENQFPFMDNGLGASRGVNSHVFAAPTGAESVPVGGARHTLFASLSQKLAIQSGIFTETVEIHAF